MISTPCATAHTTATTIPQSGEDFDAELQRAGQEIQACVTSPPLKNPDGTDDAFKYFNADVIYQHPDGKGKVYCGGIEAARTSEWHQAETVFHIVNCQGRHSRNYHEGDNRYKYYRFPIALWHGHGKITSTDPFLAKHAKPSTDVTDYFSPLFAWIDDAIEAGHNVLIHCHAGAHRAGTTSVAYLMHKHEISYDPALKLAKCYRSVIEPWAYDKLERMLVNYSKELQHAGRIDEKQVAKFQQIIRDLQEKDEQEHGSSRNMVAQIQSAVRGELRNIFEAKLEGGTR